MLSLTLFPCSSLGFRSLGTAFHKLHKCGSFSQTKVLHKLLQNGFSMMSQVLTENLLLYRLHWLGHKMETGKTGPTFELKPKFYILLKNAGRWLCRADSVSLIWLHWNILAVTCNLINWKCISHYNEPSDICCFKIYGACIIAKTLIVIASFNKQKCSHYTTENSSVAVTEKFIK